MIHGQASLTRGGGFRGLYAFSTKLLCRDGVTSCRPFVLKCVARFTNLTTFDEAVVRGT